MTNAGIFDRDYILIRQQPTAENGEIVVALLGDEATVKTFYRERNRIRLQPENERYAPIYARDNCTIVGKVIGVFRKI
jgi:repressor LexA